MGRDIPKFFQLSETGTGVFIMGFNPHSSDWVDQVATAVDRELLLRDSPPEPDSQKSSPKDSSPVRIDHQTIDYLFDRLKTHQRKRRPLLQGNQGSSRGR